MSSVVLMVMHAHVVCSADGDTDIYGDFYLYI